MREQLYLTPEKPISESARSASAMIPSVFLAGSIDLGKTEDWQHRVANVLTELGIVVFNPRKKTWEGSSTDSSDPHMFSQVNWELHYIEVATVVLFYFAPGSKAPVSMLELGMCIGSGRPTVVVCPDGFWRKGNIDIVCAKHGIPVHTSLEAGVTASAVQALHYRGEGSNVPLVKIRTKLAG